MLQASADARCRNRGLRKALSQTFELLYQTPYALTSFAHSRVAIDLIVSGIPARAFQASQQASRMAS